MLSLPNGMINHNPQQETPLFPPRLKSTQTALTMTQKGFKALCREIMATALKPADKTSVAQRCAVISQRSARVLNNSAGSGELSEHKIIPVSIDN